MNLEARPLPQTITINPIGLEEIRTRTEVAGYHFLSEKAGWFARFLHARLKKWGLLEPYMITVTRWTFYPEAREAKPLMDRILDAVDQYDMLRVMDGEAVIIMGTKDFRELAGCPEIRNYMCFDVGPVGVNDSYRGRRVAGIPIHVIPNVEGFAVVPKVLVERTR